MSIGLSWKERVAAAQARNDRAVAENAYWAARAAEVAAAEKEQRTRERMGRAELSSYLLNGGLAEMVTARAQFGAPVLGADKKLPTRFVWMPKGEHHITASRAGGGVFDGVVICDEVSARNVQASFAEFTREGLRTFIDMHHRDAEAAAWVHGFSWDPARGIMVAVEWTSAGETAVRDRIFMSFSPTFWLRDDGRVGGICRGMAAGGLVNTPAFGAAMPPILSAAVADAMGSAMSARRCPPELVASVVAAVQAGVDPAQIRSILEAGSR